MLNDEGRELYRRYIPVLCLLGRLVKELSLSSYEQRQVEAAFQAANAMMEKHKRRHRFIKSALGGYEMVLVDSYYQNLSA